MRKLLILLTSALPFLGCGLSVIPLREDPDILALKEQGSSIPLSITVAPVESMYDRDTYNETRMSEDHAYIPDFAFEDETDDITALFEEFSLFSTIRKYPGGQGAFFTEVMNDANEYESDFVVKLKLTRYKVSFLKFAGSYIPNMIGWVLFTPTSWFVHDEVFKSEVFVDFQLLDVYSHMPVFEEEIRGEKIQALNDFQRGWKLFGIFRAPGFFQVQNWEKVHGLLTPFSIKDVKKQIIESARVGELSQFTQSEEFKKKTERITALCVGVSIFDNKNFRSLKYAGTDGELAYQMFSDINRGAAVNPAFCKLLKDQQAEKEKIINQFSEIGVKRTGPNGTFIFYFAGYGYVDKAGEAYIIPFDCEWGKFSEGGVSFSELKKLVAESDAARIVFVFDCAFRGNDRGRSLHGTNTNPPQNIFYSLTADQRVSVISSVSKTQNAYEFESLKAGLFTYYFCSGALEKSADTNIDTIVSLKEMFDYASENVSEISAYKGARQHPGWFGSEVSQKVKIFDPERLWLGRGFEEPVEEIPNEEVPEDEFLGEDTQEGDEFTEEENQGTAEEKEPAEGDKESEWDDDMENMFE